MLIAYNTWFYQVGYGTFVRIATYIEFDVITLPATLVSLRLFDALLHRRALFKPMAVTFLAWQFVVIAVLVLSYEVGFSYMINQLGWDLFGPPDSLYSFTNLVLPRMIAWLVCTTPVGWMALWWYSKG